jgi:hypothetical protein
MHQDVEQVIGQWVQPPNRVLDPETADDQRANPGRTGSPNILEPKGANNAGVVRQMSIVVPDKSTTQGGQISDDGNASQQ